MANYESLYVFALRGAVMIVFVFLSKVLGVNFNNCQLCLLLSFLRAGVGILKCNLCGIKKMHITLTLTDIKE